VNRTGEIGLFTILSESGIAAGVRRIEALSGSQALEHVQRMAIREAEITSLLNVPVAKLKQKIEALIGQQKKLEKQVGELTTQLAGADLDVLLDQAVMVNGVKVVAAEILLNSPKTLREVGDKVRDGIGSGVAVLGGVIKGKVALLAIVSKDLTSQITAGDLIKKISVIVGGRGGGRPDMAQAGGPMTDKLPEAISRVAISVEELLQ